MKGVERQEIKAVVNGRSGKWVLKSDRRKEDEVPRVTTGEVCRQGLGEDGGSPTKANYFRNAEKVRCRGGCESVAGGVVPKSGNGVVRGHLIGGVEHSIAVPMQRWICT